MRTIGCIAIALLGLAGCAPVEKMTAPAPAVSNPPPVPAAQEKSTARQVVEGFTGKTAVDAGQRTMNRVKAIDAQRRQDAEEMPPY